MTETIYAPGDAHALVTAHGVALVPADLSPQLLTRLWGELEQGRGLAAVLDALTGAFGTSLTAIPAFAVALAENGALRLAVRGGLEITVETAFGAEQVSGAGVTTWTERLVSGAVRASLRTPEWKDAAALPIRSGVVRASALVLSLPTTPLPLPLPEPVEGPV